jgi:hypothetical protein
MPVAFAADWTNFQDPLEQAFSADVPQGWIVKGGLFRLGYSDARPMIDMRSPDGRINVRFGDVAIPSYFVPNRYHPKEGDIYDLGAQAQMTVANYRAGQEYAALYAGARFKEVCSKPIARQPDAGPPLQAIPADAPPVNSSSGQAAYRCDANRVTYVYATTSLYQGFWVVQALVSFAASADQAALARSILARCAASFKISPQWRERQKQMDMQAAAYQQARQQQRRRELSRQVAQFEMKMQSMRSQVSGFERQQAKQAAEVESVGNLLTGVARTVDPLGNQRTVYTGPKSEYWTNGQGRVVNSDSSPGAGWNELKQVQ